MRIPDVSFRNKYSLHSDPLLTTQLLYQLLIPVKTMHNILIFLQKSNNETIFIHCLGKSVIINIPNT